MSNRVAVALALLATGLSAGACDWMGAAGYAGQNRFFTIVVAKDDGGRCRVVAVAPEKDGFAVRKDTVNWDVVGDCTDTIVGIGRFTAREPAGTSPWEGRDEARVAKPGSRARDRVRPDATPGAYKYSIFLNGRVALDPEIQIKGRP